MTPPTVQFIPGGTDWDTYEGGIWKCSSLKLGSIFPAFTGTLVKASSYPTSHPNGIEGWASSGNRPVSRWWANVNEPPPFVAVWNDTDSRWLGVAGFTTNLGSSRAFYDSPRIQTSSGAVENLDLSQNETVYFIYLSQDPGDFSGWRNYDGPT